MWYRVGRALGLFSDTALETEPCVSTDSSTDALPPAGAYSPTYSPPGSPAKLVVHPGAPELKPCPPTIEWMTKVSDLQKSGKAYDHELYKLDIVGYYRPPRWLAEFDALFLSSFVPLPTSRGRRTVQLDALVVPSRCAYHLWGKTSTLTSLDCALPIF